MNFTFTCTFTRESNISFSALIFTKLATARRRYVRVFSAEFRPNRSRNMKYVGKHSLMLYSFTVHVAVTHIKKSTHAQLKLPFLIHNSLKH
jgi:hypothetical protein